MLDAIFAALALSSTPEPGLTLVFGFGSGLEWSWGLHCLNVTAEHVISFLNVRGRDNSFAWDGVLHDFCSTE